MNRLPNAFALPLQKVFVNRLMGREVMEVAFSPLATRALNIENGVKKSPVSPPHEDAQSLYGAGNFGSMTAHFCITHVTGIEFASRIGHIGETAHRQR